MAYGYLGDVQQDQDQRLMTRGEQAGFLARHPVVASYVAATKAAIVAGLYEWNYYDHVYQPLEWWVKFPGVIEPIGMQVDDSVFGLVTIFPARNGEIYFSVYTTDLNTEVPTTGEGAYQPPAHETGLFDDIQNALFLGGAAIVGIYLFSTLKAR